MARTLLISDLHLGARAAVSVLERRAPLELLLAELERADRLVLLGDIVELAEARPAAAMAAAAPILRAIGRGLPADVPVVLVPGNHDRLLIRNWIRRRGPLLSASDPVAPSASPLLERVVSLLGGRRVEVRYPGVWLDGESVWATHGHYLDRQLVPVSTWGLLRGGRRLRVGAGASVWDHERGGRRNLSPAMRLLPRPLAVALEDLADVVRASTMPRIQRRVLRPRIAPLTARLLGAQMRRHSLPALARVVGALGLAADAIVFGHVHRLGPLPGDDPEPWRTGTGAAILNTGSWLYEPLLVHAARPPHPYWPGGGVILEDGAPPRAVGLLDALGAADMH